MTRSGSPVGKMIIGVDLDKTGFNRGVSGLNRQMKMVHEATRAQMQVFGKYNKSVDGMGAKLDGLKQKHQIQAKIVEEAQKKYETLKKTKGENAKVTQDAAIALNREVEELAYLENQVKETETALKSLKQEQEIQSTGWHKMGDSIEGFSKNLGRISERVKDVGSSLTKRITVPAMGVITAVGGITAAFGWKRLVALDEAQAQLKGLGYDAEAVARVSDQVARAVDGGMTTMAEGTAVAAGAMAAGVKEGKDLERYIKLVGDAAVGSNRPVADMAQIFNRVQGSGKLMTQELNMIEMGMPGFAQAMADHVANGSLESFRKMVTNGEVGSKEFLEVMDGFAGGMAEAYADSWSGMVANTKANIGIIGQNLLGGVFEKSKESIGQFLGLLRSDDLREWASTTGKKIGETFSDVVDKVKDVIDWFINLDSAKQGLILKLGAVAIAAGPVLVALGTLGGVISKALLPISQLFKWLGKTKVLGVFGKSADTAGKSVGILGRLVAGLTNPIGIAITVISLLVGAFTLAYKKSETFRNFIHNLGEKLKEVFSKVMEYLQPGIDAVVNFFNEMKEKIIGFKNEEGTQLTEAFQNIGSIISVVAGAIWTAVKWCFEQIKKIINFVMPVIEFLIATTWGAIQNVINGALNVIMGAVKIFSGLFTGDFSKMWEGVKQLFFGAVEALWGYINLLFIGRILKGVVGFAKLFGGSIKNLWKLVTEIFSKSISSVWNFVKNGFTKIFNTIRTINTSIRTTISNIWSAILNRIKNIVTNLFTSVRNTFTKLRESVVNLATRMRTGIVNQWNRIKTSVSNLASNMWTSVRNTFNKMVDGAKKLPGRIGTGIRNAASKATNAVKSMGNKMLGALEKPINGMIGGVNWVTDKLGINKTIKDVKLPRFAKGTPPQGHKGGLAIIGEEGEELVKLPDGRSFLSPKGDTLVDLPKGAHVIPHKPTMNILRSGIPHFAKGTGLWESVKSGFSKVKQTVSDVWDYATNPSKLVDKILDGLGIGNITGFAKDLASAGWSYVKTKPIDYIKDLFSQSGGGGKPAFGWPITSHFGYRTHPISGARKLHGGVDFGAPAGTPVPSTTGGRVSFASGGWNGGFGNLVKVKQGMWEMFYAHLSKILVRVGQTIKKGDILGLVGSTGASTGPHLHYETRKNGVRVNPMALKGFATGGLITKKQLAWLGEEGQEIVIPLERNRRTEAMKLLALASKMIDGGDTGAIRPNRLPNPKTSGNSEELELLKEQNEFIKQQLDNQQTQIELLTQLVLKDTNVYLDGDKVGKSVTKKVTKEQNKRVKLDLAKLGV